jgi:4-amino-4-deoxy-L-arabinose transferase-like glycosyltransferase
MRARRLPVLLATGAVAVFLGLSVTYLDRYPVVIQDEPWIAAPALKLALRGVYGSDLFAGYYGAAQHYFLSMPAYPLLLAASFKLLGAGLVQARLVSVLFGGVTVLLTYVVGRRLVGTAPALLAAMLLLFWRVTRWGYVYGSGVPLLDLSRIARYDIAVAPLVLAATGLVVAGLDRAGRWHLLVAGSLVGLATLCQPYGVFWLAVFACLFVWRDGWSGLRSPSPCLVLTGFILAIVPWLLCIAMHPADYFGQMRFFHDHFRFLDPGFYLHNLGSEYQRYPVGLFSGGPRLGTLLFLVGLPMALVAMVEDAWRTRNTELAAVAFAWLVPQGLFAALDSEKMFDHVIALFPFAALALAWGCLQLWRAALAHRRWRSPLRIALAALLAGILAEGAAGILHQRTVAAATTPYTRFEARISRMLTPSALVLGSPEFQLGLLPHPFRTLTLPFLLADHTTDAKPLRLEAALERVGPNVILMERPFMEYLQEIAQPGSRAHGVYLGFEQYLLTHRARLLGQIRDPSYYYAPMRVYSIDEPGQKP